MGPKRVPGPRRADRRNGPEAIPTRAVQAMPTSRAIWTGPMFANVQLRLLPRNCQRLCFFERNVWHRLVEPPNTAVDVVSLLCEQPKWRRSFPLET